MHCIATSKKEPFGVKLTLYRALSDQIQKQVFTLVLSTGLVYFDGEVRSTKTIAIPLRKQLQLALSVASAAIRNS